MKLGKISESVLKRSVLRQIKTHNPQIIQGAAIGGDCTVCALSDGDQAACCVREAVLFTGEEAARRATTPRVKIAHLIYKCANDLYAEGAEVKAVLLSLLLPESMEENDLKQLMAEAETAAKVLGAELAGGDTRVSEAVTEPVATVTCLGDRPAAAAKALKGAAVGQDIVIGKWIGLEGTAILARRFEEKILERYPAYLVREAKNFDSLILIRDEAATAVKSGVCAMHDASEGGIFAALWELAEGAGVGLHVDLRKLPLRQETVEVCERVGVNPYELLSGGCLVMSTEDGEGLVNALHENGIPAVVVGKLTEGKERVLENEDEVRYLDRPRTDEIYRALQNAADCQNTIFQKGCMDE